jgi:hypothetical protein
MPEFLDRKPGSPSAPATDTPTVSSESGKPPAEGRGAALQGLDCVGLLLC